MLISDKQGDFRGDKHGLVLLLNILVGDDTSLSSDHDVDSFSSGLSLEETRTVCESLDVSANDVTVVCSSLSSSGDAQFSALGEGTMWLIYLLHPRFK